MWWDKEQVFFLVWAATIYSTPTTRLEPNEPIKKNKNKTAHKRRKKNQSDIRLLIFNNGAKGQQQKKRKQLHLGNSILKT